MHRFSSRLVPVLLAVVVLSACGEDELTTPTNPTPTAVTESFSGTLGRNGAQAHSVSTQGSGTVTATLKFLVPDPTVPMGLALGTWNGASCALVITKTDAVESTFLTGASSAQGSLCVYIHDVGNLAAPTDYEIEVVHP